MILEHRDQWDTELVQRLALLSPYADVTALTLNRPCRPDKEAIQYRGQWNGYIQPFCDFSRRACFGHGMVIRRRMAPATSGFTSVPPSTTRSTGRVLNSDMSISKSFVLHENLRLQLQAQAQNVFNHVNLSTRTDASIAACRREPAGFSISWVVPQCANCSFPLG